MISRVRYENRIVQSIAICIFFLFLYGCRKDAGPEQLPTTPVAIFDEAWNLMDRNYAMFGIKGVDWDNNYRTFKTSINDGMSSQALFTTIRDMLETLKDGHVSLIAGSDTAVYDQFYKSYPANFNWQNIRENYLDNQYSTSGPLVYKIDQGVAYIYYNSFYNDIDDTQVDKALGEANQASGLIIDVRNNPGGKTKNADKFFQRFITARKLVKYEKRKRGPGHEDFFEPEPVYLNAAGISFLKPVVVLTNRTCFSACNDFVMYMSTLPNVTIMGDQTGGGGGIPSEHVLANGWKIKYTSTVTLSPDKNHIENGIQPDVAVGISTFDEFSGKDPILEKAFLSLQ